MTVRNATVLREEIAVLLAKDAIEPVPPAERRQGFYSPYFIVPKKRGGYHPAVSPLPQPLLSRCLETPAWIRAQGSHHALPRSGGEPASTALGGGRFSLSVAVSRKSIAVIRGPHPERQKLRAALCLPRRAAEREGCLQTEVGPLDSGGRRLFVPVARRAVPPGGEGSLHQECCLLPCVGKRRLFGRHLQSCGLGDTETPSQDSTISALSQFLPVYWVSNGREELAGVTLAAPFPLTRGYERLFLPQVSSPGR